MNEMKISFTKLGGEECEKCEEFNLHDPNHKSDSLSDSCAICQAWSMHMNRAREARERYRQDAVGDTQSYNQRSVFSADLQKVVMLPRLDMFKSVLFTRRIIAFNESFVPVGKQQSLKPLAVIWHEGIAGRKCEDIISAFHAFFTAYRDTAHIVLWLDNCAAQNKNWKSLSYLVYLINSDETNTGTIELNYLEAGHTFMSADSFHHQVEMSLKQSGKVYDFADYETCVKNSNSGKTDVKALTDFRDWLDCSSTHKIRRMTPRPYLSGIVWFRAERGKFTVDYRTRFHEPEITCNFLTATSCKRGIPTVHPRSMPRGIPTDKKEDILSKLSGIMPSMRLKFWQDMPTAAVSDLTTAHE